MGQFFYPIILVANYVIIETYSLLGKYNFHYHRYIVAQSSCVYTVYLIKPSNSITEILCVTRIFFPYLSIFSCHNLSYQTVFFFFKKKKSDDFDDNDGDDGSGGGDDNDADDAAIGTIKN